MERKFKEGDRVKDIRSGMEGEIKSLTYSGYDKAHCVWVEFAYTSKGLPGCITKSYRMDGSELDKGVYLHHIDPPAPVLTEWQEKKIGQVMEEYLLGEISRYHGVEKIKQILSEPEPPKFVPKEYDKVLRKSSIYGKWYPDIFIEMADSGRYRCYSGTISGNLFTYCIPFNVDLIGTTDNP